MISQNSILQRCKVLKDFIFVSYDGFAPSGNILVKLAVKEFKRKGLAYSNYTFQFEIFEVKGELRAVCAERGVVISKLS